MGVSPEVIAALAGALVGVVGGIVANHFVRHLGRVRSYPSGWEKNFFWSSPNDYGEYGEIEETDLESADAAAVALVYSFDLDLFNGKDIPTGLRDLTVTLICKDGKLSSKPEDRDTRRVEEVGRGFGMGPGSIISYEEMSVINLPPRQWVHKEFQGRFEPKEGVTISEWQRAELVAKWPSRWRWNLKKTFKKTIAKR